MIEDNAMNMMNIRYYDHRLLYDTLNFLSLNSRLSRGRVGNLSSLSSNGSIGSMTGPSSQLDPENLLEYGFKPPSREKLQIEDRDRETELQKREDGSSIRGRSRDTEGDEKSVKERRVRNPDIDSIIPMDSKLKVNSDGNHSVLDIDPNRPYREPSNSLESKEHSAEILKLLSGGIEKNGKADTINYNNESQSKSEKNILQDREDRLESRSKRIDMVTLLLLSYLVLPYLLLSRFALPYLVVSCRVFYLFCFVSSGLVFSYFYDSLVDASNEPRKSSLACCDCSSNLSCNISSRCCSFSNPTISLLQIMPICIHTPSFFFCSVPPSLTVVR